jgi:hypothetical protein
MGGACSTYGERSVANKYFVGKPEGKRKLGCPRRTWEGNIKMDLEVVGREAWTGLIWFMIGPGGGNL